MSAKSLAHTNYPMAISASAFADRASRVTTVINGGLWKKMAGIHSGTATNDRGLAVGAPGLSVVGAPRL